jgi:NADPH:quinone reductase
MTELMVAAGLAAFGQELHPLRVPVPQAGPGEAMIEIAAAAVNPADAGMVAGVYPWAQPARFPLIPGYDVAGHRVGDGRPVLAFTAHKITQRGSYAPYVALPEDLVVDLPEGTDLVEASALPLAGVTALQAVEALGPDVRTLLVNSTRGAVGGFVAAIAAARGMAVVEQIGAEPGAGADAAVDVVGGERARKAFAGVRDGGRYLTVVPEFWVPGGQFTPERGITPHVFTAHPGREQLVELVRLYAAGVLKPVIGRTLPLSRAAEAHRLLGTAKGKTVLLMP